MKAMIEALLPEMKPPDLIPGSYEKRGVFLSCLPYEYVLRGLA